MTTILTAALIAAALTSYSQAAPSAPPPAAGQTLQRPPAQFLVTIVDERKAQAADDFKAADNEVKALLMDAVSLEGFDIWRRAQMQRSGQPDADFENELKRFSYYLRDFSQRCQAAGVRLHKLAETAPHSSSLASLAESLARHSADLRERAIWLETQSRDGAPDLRSAGFPNEAADSQQTSLAAAGFARDIDAQAAALLQKVR